MLKNQINKRMSTCIVQACDALQEGLVFVDAQGMVLTANTAFCSMLGYGDDEIKGKNFFDLSKTNLDRLDGRLRANLAIFKLYYFQRSEQYPLPMKLIARDGMQIQVTMRSIITHDKAGEPAVAAGIIRRTEEQFQEDKSYDQSDLQNIWALEQNYRNILQHSGDGIYVTDAQGRCIMANQAFTTITGYTQQELIGISPASLLPGDADEQMNQQMIEAMSNHDDLSLFEARWKHKNGTIFPVEVRLAVLKNAAGEDNGIVATVRDCSERKRVLEELRRSHESLEEKVSERTKGIEDVNTALRVLLKGREDDKHTHEEKILANVNELVLPYLDRLKTTRLDERQRASIAIIEANLKDIVAPFAARTASRNLSLTPSEIQIANLIKHGMTAKEIAEIISLSPRTIECHRASIRKKLGINNRKVNLRAFLMSSY